MAGATTVPLSPVVNSITRHSGRRPSWSTQTKKRDARERFQEQVAETTEFNHDQLGHILADQLVVVPEFQRSYSWDTTNVQEYLSDLEQARLKGNPYFMGTLVFAKPDEQQTRRRIVDGQQRLATTALLLVAIRDQLRALGKEELANNTEARYLRRYNIREEGEVDSLILTPRDQDAYDYIRQGAFNEIAKGDKVLTCYQQCLAYLEDLAPEPDEYKQLVDLIDLLNDRVQVLVAVASDLPEAYVIFETLNDRGADLTTADLLKNFLFSKSPQSDFKYVESSWNALESNFNYKPDSMVKFIRHEYISRHGRVTTRKLYRAIQEDLQVRPGSKAYVRRLKEAQPVHVALGDPNHTYWDDVHVDVKDAVLAYRRFGFEGSYPVLLAAFRKWDKQKAARLFVKMANWSVRAQFFGTLGSGNAEEDFGNAAKEVSNGGAVNQGDVLSLIQRIIPSDTEFKTNFKVAGKLQTSRAKYVLAMLEKASDVKAGNASRALDWGSSSVTIEHILPQSAANNESSLARIHEIGNLALLEKKLNRQIGSKPFDQRVTAYKQSDYRLTRDVAKSMDWDFDSIEKRTDQLSELACLAWPLK